MKPLLPNKSRAKTAVFMLWIIVILSIIVMGSTLMEMLHLQGIKHGAANENPMEFGADGVFVMAYSLLTIASIISGVTFLLWYHRAYSNLKTILIHTKYSPSIAIICWFIPLTNMYIPRRIIAEMWVKAEDIVAHVGRSPINPSKKLINIWGSLFILTIIIWVTTSAVGSGAEGIDQSIHAYRMNFFVHLAEFITAFMTIRIVRQYSQKEDVLADLDEEELFYVHELYRSGEATIKTAPETPKALSIDS